MRFVAARFLGGLCGRRNGRGATAGGEDYGVGTRRRGGDLDGQVNNSLAIFKTERILALTKHNS